MKRLLYYTSILIATALYGCTGGANSINNSTAEGDTLTKHSQLLTLIDYADYKVADVKNPWDTAAAPKRYILIKRDAEPSDSMPDGIVVKVPLQSTLVYSSVHAGIISEFGAIDKIKAVADGGYFVAPEIVQRIADGRIADVGNSMSPSIERIVEINPDAIFASPFQNAGFGAVETLGIPIIECADYMENTPLGRAEWMKFFGALFGESQCADSIFEHVELEYDSLCTKVQLSSYHPKVITEQVNDGVWYIPGGNSYMARMLNDAGAYYPWSDDTAAGSLQLDFSAVYDKAHDADFWLIRNYGSDLTLKELRSNYSLNAKFKAFEDKQIYTCNTAVVPLFDEFPFHPERLLREFIAIFHPEYVEQSYTLRYYKRIGD